MKLKEFEEISSTNAEALRCAGRIEIPTWFLAYKQTAGRGRGGKAWVDPVGDRPDRSDFCRSSPLSLRSLFKSIKISAFFYKIHKLPAILCHFPQFRQNSVKFAAKNARFAEKSAKFCKNLENSTINCKITQKLALERCKGVTIL